MRVVSACLGLVVVCGLGCGGRGIDKVLADLPTNGQGGSSTGEAARGGLAGAAAPVGGMADMGSSGGAGGGTTVGTGGAGQAGHPGVGGHPNGCCFSPRPGAGGSGDMGGGPGGPGTGGGAGAGGPTACGSFAVGSALTLAPAAPGQAYVRCGSLGPEQGWTVTPSPSGD